DMYGKCGLISNARKVFDERFVNVVPGRALLEIYWKCCDVGWFTETQRVFDDLTYKNVVTLTSMVTRYAEWAK
nr:hypothetical protein [Tanacetum cinerariifolium]